MLESEKYLKLHKITHTFTAYTFILGESGKPPGLWMDLLPKYGNNDILQYLIE